MKKRLIVFLFFCLQIPIHSLYCQLPYLIDSLQSEIKTKQTKNDNKGVVLLYLKTADAYYNQGIYPAASQYIVSALKLSEEIKYDYGTAASYNSRGKVYCQQGNYKDALLNYKQALDLFKMIKDTASTADCYTNIGILYFNQNEYPEAITNYNNAVSALHNSKDFRRLTMLHTYIGNVYQMQNNNDEALVFYLTSLETLEKMKDKENIAICCIHIGAIYLKKGNTEAALDYTTKGLALAKELGLKEWMKEGYRNLASVYSKLKKFETAYNNQVLFQQINDSLFNDEDKKRILEINTQYEFDKKDAEIKAQQADQEEKLQTQKIIRNYLFGGLAIVLLFSIVFFVQRNKVRSEKKRSDDLLLNILPEEVAEELKTTGIAIAKHYDMVTVMFTDFKNFTLASEKLNAKDLVREIHHYYSAFDRIIAKHDIEKIKTIGDSYMCAGGLPIANQTNAVECVRAALEIQKFIDTEKEHREKRHHPYFEIRIGLHTGPVVAGIVGINKFAYDIWGDTVNIASRMESSGEPGKINISGATYELVKHEFVCKHRGKVDAKNKGEIDMYYVENKRI